MRVPLVIALPPGTALGAVRLASWRRTSRPTARDDSIMWNDVRFAARLLRKRRGLTIAAVAALAVGMSATIAMFTVVNGV